MEKFQNFLRGFGNFMVGMPSEEVVDEIRKNNPQMDIFKTDTQLEQEGKVRNQQGDVIDVDTGVITKSGSRKSTFSLEDYLKDVGKKIKTDIGKAFEGKEETTETPERNYLEENKELLADIARLSEEARAKNFLRQGIGTLVNAPAVAGESALRSAEVLNRLAIANMGAMAAQNRVLESNPTKLQIAGKYFRS